MTQEDLIKRFVEHPSYMETGGPKLAKQFNVTLEFINLVKKKVRDLLKSDIMKEVNQESISLKDFAKTIGIDMDANLEYPELDQCSDEKDVWEEKVKWVKTKDCSRLYVRTKEQLIDYKKEFELFVNRIFENKTLEWTYEAKHYETNPELCLVLCLFDVHIGRESYKHYTEDSTNMQLQEQEYVNAINTLIQNLPYDRFEKIILPIGNDFFNIDTPQGTTTKGTPQDNTKDLHSMFYTGLNLLSEVSLYLSSLAPVELILVPGNHDTVTSNYLATSLKVLFKDNSRIFVDDSPISRKYRQFGATTLGFAHGELKMEKYAELLPYEAKEMFATSKWYEYLLGDKHHEKMIQKEDCVVVRHLGGMTKSDVWTYTNGYTTSKRRAYGIIYHKEQGRQIEIIHQL